MEESSSFSEVEKKAISIRRFTEDRLKKPDVLKSGLRVSRAEVISVIGKGIQCMELRRRRIACLCGKKVSLCEAHKIIKKNSRKDSDGNYQTFKRFPCSNNYK